MLTEARDLGEELGDTEILAEAMAWRVPALVALCDLDARASGRSRAARDGRAHRASRSCCTSPSSTRRRSRCATGASTRRRRSARRSHEWGRLLTGRDASGVYGIQMFSVRREQGRLAELAPVVRVLAARPDRDGAWRPGLAALLVELGMEREARRELARLAPTGSSRSARRSGWPRSSYLTDACAALGDADVAALLYPELEPLAGGERHDRPPRRLLRRGRPLPRGCSPRRSATRDRAAERTSSARSSWTGGMGAPTWYAHTAYEYARFLLGRGRAEREARPGAARRGRARWPSGIRHAGAAAPRPGARPDAARQRRLPDGLSPREAQILGLVAAGSSNRQLGRSCASASTPPPTTSAASCARPAARTAPKQPPPTPHRIGARPR